MTTLVFDVFLGVNGYFKDLLRVVTMPGNLAFEKLGNQGPACHSAGLGFDSCG